MLQTTIRVNKQDALILKQIQNFLEMRERSLTQSELLHHLLQFLLEYENDFFREIEMMERHRRRHEKMLEEWMRVILKKTREL